MNAGWLFDPDPEPPRGEGARAHGGRAREEASGESVREILDGVVADAGGIAADDAPLDFRSRLGNVVRSVRFGAYVHALDQLDELSSELRGDPIECAIRACALAGLDRIEEAEEQVLRAKLHAARSEWRMESLLLDAQKDLVDARSRRKAQRSNARRAASRKSKARASDAKPGGHRSARVSAGRREAVGRADVLPPPDVELRFSLERRPAILDSEAADPGTAFRDYQLRSVAVLVDQLRRYDTLLSLGVAQGVDHYEYQLRTVRRVLRDFRGRALLADEVGLGKTVEACLCLEEYLQRGLARRTLLLVPPGLLLQWRDELKGKFGREARIVDGALARRDPEVWCREPLVLASMALARAKPHAGRIVEAGFDMVIVDEAHRLKNRSTLLYKLVDRLRARYLLLLSATPVENNLLEIYNVLSLLRPGLFSTRAEFRRRFIEPGKRTPRDPAALRSLLRQVMIRNTRAVAEARLPPRFATTLRASPGEEETRFRTRLDAEIRACMSNGSLSRRLAGQVLRAAGARPPAAARVIERHLGPQLAEQASRLGASAKDELLADLLGRRRDDKVIVFATHRETVTHLAEVARSAGRDPVVFHGSLSAAEKARAVETFRDSADTMVATDSGGEGFNLHFARTVVNYDLPWNPMRIEQRIGRVHRIGQAREVFVFNLVAEGTVEEEILRVLDEKIDMFELVVGEVEAILGRLGDDEREFSDLVLDIYAEASSREDMRGRFDALAEQMLGARKRHLEVVAVEEEVFGRDMEA